MYENKRKKIKKTRLWKIIVIIVNRNYEKLVLKISLFLE